MLGFTLHTSLLRVLAPSNLSIRLQEKQSKKMDSDDDFNERVCEKTPATKRASAHNKRGARTEAPEESSTSTKCKKPIDASEGL